MQTENPLSDVYVSPLAAFYTSLRMEGTGAPAVTTPPAGGEGGAAGGEDAAAAAAKAAADQAAADAAVAAAAAGTGTAAGGDADDPAGWDKDRAAGTIKHLRGREGDLQRQLAAEKAAREEAERKNMSEDERKEAERKATQEENERLRTQARSSTLFATLAGRPEIADAEIARDLLLQRGLKFDDNGQPIDLDTQVNSLLEAKPVLRKADGGSASAPTGGGTGGGSAAAPNANGGAGSGGQGPSPQLTQDEVQAANDAGMSPEKFAAMKGGMSLSGWEERRKQESEAAAGK